MSTLNIHERRVGEVTILDMDGNIRIGGSNVALKKAIRSLLEEGRNQIVLNLARVTYIDSNGLGELISSHVTSNHKGGQIKLLNLTQRFHELMTTTKLITIFDVHTDESQAIHSFESHDAIAVPTVAGMTSAPVNNG